MLQFASQYPLASHLFKTGLMDVVRTLLVFGLVLAVWFLPLGKGCRPVHDFVRWGAKYPPLFIGFVFVTLIVWGLIGPDYGLQNLFLTENRLLQFELGVATALFLLGLDYQFLVLDSSVENWRTSLKYSLNFNDNLNKIIGGTFQIEKILPNGFLDKLELGVIDRLRRTAALEDTDQGQESVLTGLKAIVEDADFRILMAPALLISGAFFIILLVGIIPLIGDFQSRWPWLLGLILGSVLAIFLSCWTSTQVTSASQWSLGRSRPTENVIHLVITRLPKQVDYSRDEATEGSVFRRFIIAFVLMHGILHISHRFEPPSPVEPVMTWQFLFLIVEALAAVLLALFWPRIGSFGGTLFDELQKAIRGKLEPVGLLIRRVPTLRRLLLLLVLLAVVAIFFLLGNHVETRTFAQDIMSFLLLLAYLVTWLLCFFSVALIAALPELQVSPGSNAPAHEGGAATSRLPRFLIIACLGLMVGVVLWALDLHPWAELAAGVPALALAFPAVLNTASQEPRLPWFSPLGTLIIVLLAITVSVLQVWAPHSWSTTLWMVFAVVAISGLFHWALIRSNKAAMAHPVSGLFGYVAFALLYNSLGIGVQALFPAGASLLILFGLIAMIFLAVRFTFPRIATVMTLGLFLGALVINGNAWMTEPNHFKLKFPGLEYCYGAFTSSGKTQDSPTYLDSRAYMRSTTASVVKLWHSDLVDSQNRQLLQVENQRLGSAYFEVVSDQQGALILEVQDPRGRFHAAKGDRVSLILPDQVLKLGPNQNLAPGDKNKISWQFHHPRFTKTEEPANKSADPQEQRRAAIIKKILDSEELRMWFERPDADEEASKIHGVMDKCKLVNKSVRVVEKGEDALPFQSTEDGLEVFETETKRPPRLGRQAPPTAAFAAVWRGEVTTVEADGCTIRFPNFSFGPVVGNLDAQNEEKRKVLELLREQIHEGHLILERPKLQLTAESMKNEEALIKALHLHPGDCVVLEHRRNDYQVIAETLCYSRGEGSKDYQLSVNRLDQLTKGKPLSEVALQAAHMRGVFRVSSTNPDVIWLARGDRVRKKDWLILRWKDADQVEHSRMFNVDVEIGEKNRPDNSFEGFSAVKLELDGWGESASDTPHPGPQETWLDGTWRLGGWPLDNVEVLESWKRRMPSGPKPPLVIVTVSGGGIRASVWTETVLRALERELGGCFPYHIRLLTGASGGMVAASHFVTSLPEPPPLGVAWGHVPVAKANEAGERLSEDQLNAVAGCLVFNDIPGLFNPIERQLDRGRKLEETWEMLTSTKGAPSPMKRPLRGFAADELAGWRPSLVFTPMMVEDGRRLLITNLNLSFVARNVGRLMMERDSRRVDPAYWDDFGPTFWPDDDLYSLSALEFFRLFPGAWDFKVSTAVRMSASFPLVSPAVSLPTLPPRRVVDAGYYDNYGVNLAANWLTTLRQWLLENTNGVVVIQIRDWISQQARTQVDFDRRTEPSSSNSLLERITWNAGSELLTPGFYPTNTPIQGLSSARQWSMSFRNDEQVEMFDSLLRASARETGAKKPGDKDPEDRTFFRTVVFECPVQASLSWTLSQREKEWIEHGLGAATDTDTVLRDFRDGDRVEIERLLADQRRGHHKQGETPEQTLRRELKNRYDVELKKLGYCHLEQLTSDETEDLYGNVMNNRARLQTLKSWWRSRGGFDCPKAKAQRPVK
ncbi:MAG: patatin-like phospholipase family protein [Isosphaeraceae bacterium]